MTREEILNIDNLEIASVDKFVHLHTKEGFILTPFKDGDDIKEYYGSECFYMPIKDEYEDLRTITIEQHLELEEKRDNEIKNIENE